MPEPTKEELPARIAKLEKQSGEGNKSRQKLKEPS
jgi:hypothetical protein